PPRLLSSVFPDAPLFRLFVFVPVLMFAIIVDESVRVASVSTFVFHAMSAGNTWHPPMVGGLAEPPPPPPPPGGTHAAVSDATPIDRKSTRLNSSHVKTSY